MTQYFNLNEHTMQAHPMDLVGGVNPETLAKGLERTQVGEFQVMSVFTGVDRLTTIWRGDWRLDDAAEYLRTWLESHLGDLSPRSETPTETRLVLDAALAYWRGERREGC